MQLSGIAEDFGRQLRVPWDSVNLRRQVHSGNASPAHSRDTDWAAEIPGQRIEPSKRGR